MNILFKEDMLVKQFSEKAKELSKQYDKDMYYKKIFKIYKDVIKNVKK